MVAVAFISLLLSLSVAAEPAAEEVPPPSWEVPPPSGTVTRPPRLKRAVEAEYPPQAREAGIAGSVLLSIVIGETGAVQQVSVLDGGSHPDFAPAALHAAAQLEFEPAEIDGKPAAVEISYRFDFAFQPAAPAAPVKELGPVVIVGRVTERGTRAPIAGAVIQAGASMAETDAQGRFSLRGLPPGPADLRVTSPNHLDLTAQELIRADAPIEVEYRLDRRSFDPFEATVHGDRGRTEPAAHTLRAAEIVSVAGTQGDTLKALQNLPGVARPAYGIGLLAVRGSPPQDTKVYLDGVEIPILFHFGGITSVLDSEVLSSVEYLPGNFGARYGRAMGGAIEVQTRDGRSDLHGSAQVDVFDGRLLLEAPIGQGSFLAAMRRSWIDGALALALPKAAPDTADQLRVAPRYYDWQLKLTEPLLGGTASLMFYGTDDQVTYVRDEDLSNRPSFRLDTFFYRLAARWRRSLGDGGSQDLVLSYGRDRLDVIQSTNYGVQSTVDAIALRDTTSLQLAESFTLRLGADVQYRLLRYSDYAPPGRAPGSVGGQIASGPGLGSGLGLGGLDGAIFGTPGQDYAVHIGEEARTRWFAPALFLEAEWRPAPWLRLIPGIRLEGDSRLHRDPAWIDPRFTAALELSPETTVTAAAGLYGEPPQPEQLTHVFGNPRLGLQRARELSLGLAQGLPLDARLEVTGYFKDLRNLVASTRAVDAQGNLLQLSNSGRGQVWGLEVMLRRPLTTGLYGWLSYAYSVSLRLDDPSLPSSSRWHRYDFDQTHVLTLVLSYRTGGWTFGTRIRAASGNPYTPSAGSVYMADSGTYACVPATRPNSGRLPFFFQADARIDRRFVFDRWILSAYLDVQNATNRSNTEFRFPNYDCTEQLSVPGLPIFPTVGVRAEW